MAIKSKEWFYKQCLEEYEKFSPLMHLCWTALKKGIGQQDQTRGHVTQAIGAIQGFLDAFPDHVDVIRASDPTRPFPIEDHAAMLRDWLTWFARKRGAYGRFGYNFDTLRTYLTRRLGGRRRHGGGGNDEFKRVLRLLADFI